VHFSKQGIFNRIDSVAPSLERFLRSACELTAYQANR
jgi:hypothetical protein